MISPVKIWRNQKRIQHLLGSEGVIVTWTEIFVPPGSFSSQAPYPVALVDLDTKERVIVQLVDWEKEQLHVGQKVKIVLRRITETADDGVIPYGIKATPI